MNIKKLRRTLLIILAVVALGFSAINFWMVGNLSTVPNKQEAPIAQSFAPAAIGGAFSLTNQDGAVMTDKDFAGKLMFVYFGFTNCPDVCGVAMLSMSNVLDQLGEKAGGVAPLFITLDPERDTPEALKKYLANFSPRFTGLTGNYGDISKVIQAYKAYAAKQPADKEGNYLVDHSSFIYLMGNNGEYLAHFPHNAPESEMKTAIEGLLK